MCTLGSEALPEACHDAKYPPRLAFLSQGLGSELLERGQAGQAGQAGARPPVDCVFIQHLLHARCRVRGWAWAESSPDTASALRKPM